MFSISKNPQASMAEVLAKAEKYINGEEALISKKENSSTHKEKSGTDKRRGRSPKRQSDREGSPKKNGERSPKRRGNLRDLLGPPQPERRRRYSPQRFTPLTASVSQVLREVRNEQFLRWPTQMKSDPATRDNSKYCEFHKDYGHRTNDCIQLKREIEYLIRRGYLRRFISPENQSQNQAQNQAPAQQPPPRQTTTQHQQPIGEIHVISGGFAGGGESSSARKAHLRSIRSAEIAEIQAVSKLPRLDTFITFSDSDLEGCQHPHDDPEHLAYIGSKLAEDLKSLLTHFLRQNKDVFAWKQADMGGIDPIVITHRLNVSPSFKQIKQKRRSFALEGQKAINEEVGKLLQAGAIREVEYPEWLANVVLVKKANGKWQLCIDFTDINRACPKDSFPLPRIDLIVDATAGHELLNFMDTFSGYNQISMDLDDREKTSFVTAQGTYCYRVMPFGLKNAGATYQRLVNRMFQKKIGTTMEVYIDDMLVKSTTTELHIAHLSEAFQILRNYNMKLNPAKCAFGVSAGKFLGFIVNHRGIEANPDKIRAMLDMPSPSGIKEVQLLTGRIAALSRFISRASDK